MENEYQIGGKAQGLNWLRDHQKEIGGYKVPRFDVMDTSFYEEYLKAREIARLNGVLHGIIDNGNDRFDTSFDPHVTLPRLEQRCRELHEKYKYDEVAIRSSAVYSEDGENLSGAGIYESEFLEVPWKKSEVSFDDFFNAVLKVYESVDSPKARAYREENGIPNERMGIVVQKAARPIQNGVAYSRLQGRAGIVPVMWSSFRGAIVGGGTEDINHAYFHFDETPHWGGEPRGWVTKFHTEDTGSNEVDILEKQLLPVIQRVREAYGKECDIEFSLDLPYRFSYEDPDEYNIKLNLLQIRPLTGITDTQVRFPHRKIIFKSNMVMGAGEYIGPWIQPIDVMRPEFEEPGNYALITPKYEAGAGEYNKRTDELLGSLRSIRDQLNRGRNHEHDPFLDRPKRKNLEDETPNKRALILTDQHENPGTHALSIANERGILCMIGKGTHKEEVDEFDTAQTILNDSHLTARLGMPREVLMKQRFNVPLEEVSDYVHIVSDGLVARMYNATRGQAVRFARKHGLPEPK